MFQKKTNLSTISSDAIAGDSYSAINQETRKAYRDSKDGATFDLKSAHPLSTLSLLFCHEDGGSRLL
jgi:hypothetical protein